MCYKLPVSDYKWEDAIKWSVNKIMSINDYDNKGYFFDVDIEYPKELHDKHNDYLLLPEGKLILTEM